MSNKKTVLGVQTISQGSLTFLKLLRLVTFLWIKHQSMNIGSCGKCSAQKYSSYSFQECVWQQGDQSPQILLLFEHWVCQLKSRWNGEARPAAFPNFNPIPALFTRPCPPNSPACPAVDGIGCDLPALVWSVRLQFQTQTLMLWSKSQAGQPRHLLDHSWVLFAVHSTFENFHCERLYKEALLSSLPQSHHSLFPWCELILSPRGISHLPFPVAVQPSQGPWAPRSGCTTVST